MSKEFTKYNLPKNWVWTKLTLVTNVRDGDRKPINTSERQTRKKGKKLDELFPYYGATGQVDKIDDYLIDGEFVLVGEDGAPFLDPLKPKAYRIIGKSWVNNHAHILEANYSMNSQYVLHYLNQLDYSHFVNGTTRLKLTKGNLEKISIPLSPLEEQNRIIQKIDSLFNVIEKGEEHLKNAQYQLKLYRESVLQKAFTGQLSEEWRNDNNPEIAGNLLQKIKNNRKVSYEKEIEKWKDSKKLWEKNGKEGERPIKPKQNRIIPPTIESDLEKLPTIPSSWMYTKLGFLGDLQRGKSKHRPRNDSRLFGGKHPFIQTSEIRNANVVIHNFNQTYSDFGLQQSKLWKKGTLCITIAANIAETAFLGFDACFPDSVVGFTPEPGVSDKYIFYFIQFSKKQIEKFAPATAQKNINLSILDNVFTPFCSIEEQNSIVKYLEKVYSSIEELEDNILDSLNKADVLRQSILKKAFKGKLVPQDPNDEPASELLRKIQKEKREWQEFQKEKKKIRKPKTRMESLTIEQVLKKAEEPISPKELWETSKHKHDIEEFYLELKKLGDKVVEIKNETESLLRLEDAN